MGPGGTDVRSNVRDLPLQGWETTLETSGEDVELHSKRVEKIETTLETSGEDVELHSKRVENMCCTGQNDRELYKKISRGTYTTPEIIAPEGENLLCETTLETSGEDKKIHSKRVEKITNYTRTEWRRCKTTLEPSGEDVKLHSNRVEKM